MLAKYQHLREAYDRVRTAGADPFNVAFDTILSPTRARLQGRDVLLLGTNNYLGLTFDESCREAAAAAVRAEGTGTTGSRVANGTYSGHVGLERQIAAFFGRRDAMVFTTGYQANVGILPALAGRGDHLLLDGDSHASIYDGAKMSEASVTRFRHNDPADLRRRLRHLADQPGQKLIVVEGIYSMLGDTAPLAEFAAIKRETGAHLLVDEAHSLGVLGAHGRGLAEAEAVEADVDFIVGTFSKSLGGIGGFCASSVPDFELLRLVSRAYMFSASLTPATIAGVSRALELVAAKPALRQDLWRNATYLYRGLAAAGLAVGPQLSPIISIAVRDPQQAVAMWNRLLASGLYVNLALPPATPGGQALLRTSVSAAHTAEDLEFARETIIAAATAFGLIESTPALAAAQ
jgi:8-amino-7-oxononanoate synthase